MGSQWRSGSWNSPCVDYPARSTKLLCKADRIKTKPHVVVGVGAGHDHLREELEGATRRNRVGQRAEIPRGPFPLHVHRRPRVAGSRAAFPCDLNTVGAVDRTHRAVEHEHPQPAVYARLQCGHAEPTNPLTRRR